MSRTNFAHLEVSVVLCLDLVTLQALVVCCSEVPAGRCPPPFKWDRQTALVHKDSYVFDPHLQESFVFAHRHASESAVHVALDRFCPPDCVKQQPRRLNTEVGEQGAHASGGQRQPLAVARIFLAGVAVVSCDEVGEHLDTASPDALAADSTRGQAAVVVSHRLAGMEHGNEISALDAGGLNERGSHAHLIPGRGRYAQGWQRQRRLDAVMGVLR